MEKNMNTIFRMCGNKVYKLHKAQQNLLQPSLQTDSWKYLLIQLEFGTMKSLNMVYYELFY